MDNTPLRRALLALGVALGAYVGGWAFAAPDAFYRSFPGFGLHWIDVDGPFNEHLIRDVGALYLGLGAASLAAALSRSAQPGRVVGLAWAVFGVLHFGYHASHPEGSAGDIAGALVSLGLSALLGLALLLPVRKHTVTKGRPTAAEVLR
ncbi:hypothetical protein P5G50_01555 [Leifsonia sp. F6_8S_P_1B]|uniref:DUF4383 domain-containing protein n=1 Tax=Leifsonia williamsii TaxID=3035919 RepID=A0ABT8K9Y5_9MICO|nr:hypothetical protein [Leifsonia williamsii]MDN4613124.1 hypothetical protein [Leifsonia williamsii]